MNPAGVPHRPEQNQYLCDYFFYDTCKFLQLNFKKDN